jgi:hypothetical protein
VKNDVKKKILEAVSAIPEAHLTDSVIKETIRCVLFYIYKTEA